MSINVDQTGLVRFGDLIGSHGEINDIYPIHDTSLPISQDPTRINSERIGDKLKNAFSLTFSADNHKIEQYRADQLNSIKNGD